LGSKPFGPAPHGRRRFARGATLAASAAAWLALAAPAAARNFDFVPGSLLVSSSQYRTADITPGETLPIGCTQTTSFGGVSCATAGYDGTYPTVFNNAPIDPNFGITSPIFLDDLGGDGSLIHHYTIPPGHMVTSFSSKSELALNFDPSGQNLTFMGYDAPIDGIDVSNSNTPGAFDPSNPVPQSYYREVADINSGGSISYTATNAFSGNNGRAAILDNNAFYTSGNAGNGNTPEPANVILGGGDSIIPPGQAALNPSTPFGSFNVTQLDNAAQDPADKIGKDTNFRGLTISGNVVYLTKGSGGNGIDTVYFVDTTGSACTNGVGVPAPGASLPGGIPLTQDTASLQANGVLPYNMCVLRGFPTISQKAKAKTCGCSVPPNTPFGIWFANPDTLYVADEGDGAPVYDPTTNTYTDATSATNEQLAGLEKWVFNGTQWNLAYTLNAGLNLGQPYTVPGYPTGDNAATGLPWAPATDGLRNITGRMNPDGTVTIYAVTSTVSGSGDQGADPNRVVAITDTPGAPAPATGEAFSTVETAASGQVLRGVAVVPENYGSGS
jgi:hypothetical protein